MGNQSTTTGKNRAPSDGRSLLREQDLRADADSYDLDADSASDPCAALFLAGARAGDLRYLERREFPRESDRLHRLESLGEVELSWRLDQRHQAVVRPGRGILALLTVGRGDGVAVVAARTADAAEAGAAALAQRLREEPGEPEDLEVCFWTGGGNVWRDRRRIEAPALAEVAANYPVAVRARFEELASMDEPGGGSLILWHGPPGTGKSHALRALGREWRGWCSLHYVTDPEVFLGSGTSYLMQIVRERADDGDDGRPWQLIALEDAGELMAADARSETGQALSRLLNLTDGCSARACGRSSS